MDINIFFARFHAALATVGRAGRGFGTTDLLTSLREEKYKQTKKKQFGGARGRSTPAQLQIRKHADSTDNLLDNLSIVVSENSFASSQRAVSTETQCSKNGQPHAVLYNWHH